MAVFEEDQKSDQDDGEGEQQADVFDYTM